jgi:hypothetical protein
MKDVTKKYLRRFGWCERGGHRAYPFKAWPGASQKLGGSHVNMHCRNNLCTGQTAKPQLTERRISRMFVQNYVTQSLNFAQRIFPKKPVISTLTGIRKK